MAKVKRRKISWKPSKSRQVVGYKLYWVEGSGVSYNAKHVTLGNVTEVILPDDVPGLMPCRGPVEIGLTALDELGNESNMVVISAPYQCIVPEPPSDLKIETMPDYAFISSETETNRPEPKKLVRPDFPANQQRKPLKRAQTIS